MASLDFEGRLIIASNRLPVTVKCQGDGLHAYTPSSGGLVTGLSGLANSGIKYTWYGWPGSELSPQHISKVRRDLLQKHNAVPVLLDQTTADQYYDGFSNSTLWPLFHDQLDKACYSRSSLAAYQRANEIFADTIAPDLQDGDCIWVQDYHLMLLPQLLRQRARQANINIRIGWFLHTSFPNEDAFNVLPLKTEIMEGILGADVVGFQTDEVCQRFSNARFATSRRSTNAAASFDRHNVFVGTFPIGIEPSEFHDRLRTKLVQDSIRTVRARFHGAKVIVGIDRLDYIKGVPQRLRAFERFLADNADWVGHISLVQLVIPSRANLNTHQSLLARIQSLVGEINGKYGWINYVPIHFVYGSIPPPELTALYTIADVCFVASTRDGMNLVSYEYVACHSAGAVQASQEAIAPGVLVLSQFAGAAGLLKEALLVNPWDSGACAVALAQAVNMRVGEARLRMQELGKRVEEHTSRTWGLNFLGSLMEDSDQVWSASESSSGSEGLVLDLKKASSNLGRVDSVLSP